MASEKEELEKLQRLEAELKTMEEAESVGEEYGFPEAPKKESVYRFFKYLLALGDSSKTGNLSVPELGQLKLHVRGYRDIAAYARSEGLSDVANYLDNKGEILLATSLSKKGFLPQLFVTQIKKEQKVKPTEEVKKKWFVSKKSETME